MSEFFDWITDFTPALVYILIWGLLFPIRITVLLVLPHGAKKGYHALNPIYEFFAFEERL